MEPASNDHGSGKFFLLKCSVLGANGAGTRSSPAPPTSPPRSPDARAVVPTNQALVVPATPGTDSPSSVTINFTGPSSGNNIQVVVGVRTINDLHNSPPSDQTSLLTNRRPEGDARVQLYDDRYPWREVPERLEKIVNEVADVAFNAAVDRTFKRTVQHPIPEDPIAGMTLWAPYMNEPVRERHRDEYKVGQICMTYVLETSSNPNLKREEGHTAVRTSVGLLAGKWRPAIVVEVLENHCVVAEMGRRSNRVFEGLTLNVLLERCGVITRVNAGKFDPWNEKDELFRSIFEPLRVERYYQGCRPFEDDSAVQFFRLNSKSFDYTCSPIGELTEDSTKRLLQMQTLSKQLKEKAEFEHTAYYMNKRIHELTPVCDFLEYDYRKAIINLKKDIADIIVSTD